MGQAVRNLQRKLARNDTVNLARIYVPPYLTHRGGKIVHAEGYWRSVLGGHSRQAPDPQSAARQKAVEALPPATTEAQKAARARFVMTGQGGNAAGVHGGVSQGRFARQGAGPERAHVGEWKTSSNGATLDLPNGDSLVVGPILPRDQNLFPGKKYAVYRSTTSGGVRKHTIISGHNSIDEGKKDAEKYAKERASK